MLISISSEVDAKILASWSSHGPDAKRINNTQVRVPHDIKLGIMNGMTTEEVRSLITDICDGEDVSDGAQMGIDHVLSYMDEFAHS